MYAPKNTKYLHFLLKALQAKILSFNFQLC